MFAQYKYLDLYFKRLVMGMIHVLHKLSTIEVNCFPVRFKLLGFFSNLAANDVSRRLVLQDSHGSAVGRANLT